VIESFDESLRALLDVPVAAAKGDERTSIRVWIDTAFNGGLVIRCQAIRHETTDSTNPPPRSQSTLSQTWPIRIRGHVVLSRRVGGSCQTLV